MARVFITGSSDGLGLMAARLLIEERHSVIAHARSEPRADQTKAALPGAEQVVTGDLSSMEQTRGVADQVNALGDVDAVIYNAGVGPYERQRVETADGLSHVFEIDVLAAYILTALIARPRRMVYLTSGMHRGGDPALDDPQWEHRAWQGSQAYSDSKLFDLALAMAVGRRWPDVLSNAVNPGWVPTKMGGAGAPDDLAAGGPDAGLAGRQRRARGAGQRGLLLPQEAAAVPSRGPFPRGPGRVDRLLRAAQRDPAPGLARPAPSRHGCDPSATERGTPPRRHPR